MVKKMYFSEEQGKWRLSFFRIMLVIVILLLCGLIGLRRFEVMRMTENDFVLIGMVLVFTLQLIFTRRRYRTSAGISFILVTFCSLCYLSYNGRGVHDSSVFAYLALILLASLLLEIKYAAFIFALTLAWLWILATLQARELVKYSIIDPPLAYVRDITVAFLIVAGLGYFFYTRMNIYISRLSTELAERTKTEAALRESEESFRSLFEQASEGIVIGKDSGEIIMCNLAFEKLTGFPGEDLPGRNIEFLFHRASENILDFVNFKAEQVDIREQRIIKKDGSLLMVEVRSKKLTDGRLQLLITDISERVKADKAAKDFERIFTLSTNPICVGQQDGTLLRINPALAKKLGYKISEIEGRNIMEFLHPDDVPRVSQFVNDEIEKKSKIINVEARYLTKGGEVIWMSSSTQAIYEEKIGFTIGYDITELKKVEKELIRAKERAEESDELKSSFLANMSHEVRTPMNGIIGFAEMIMSPDTVDAERIHYAKIVHNNAVKLLTLLDDIINISRIETGALELNFEAVGINNLLEEIYEFNLSKAREKNLRYEIVKGLSDSKATIYTDRIRLHQILSNLLTNALKFTKEGSIRFGYEHSNGMIKFFVEDTGIGISKKAMDLIFERFRQADHSVTKEFGGTGLGLSISNKLVELLGGKIWLESEKGKGSTFFFTIPFKEAEMETFKKTPREKENTANSPADNLLLVVEDDEINMEYIVRLLRKEGFETIQARNGVEAIDFVKTRNEISLVFMDVKMPLMNGYDATRAIKLIRPELPVIAQTAFAMDSDRRKASEAGCDAYLTKPINREELLQELSRQLRQ